MGKQCLMPLVQRAHPQELEELTPLGAASGEQSCLCSGCRDFSSMSSSASLAFTLKLHYGHRASCLETDAERNNLFSAEDTGNQGLGIFW